MFRLRLKFRPALASGVLAAAMVLAGSLPAPALADDDAPPSGFPSWQDVQNAQRNEASKADEVSKITALLDGLQAQAAELGNAAVKSAADYAVAKSALDAASARVDVLAAQTQRANAQVEQYKKEAGALAAQTYKAGGANLGVFVALDALQSKDSLQRLDVMRIVTEKASKLYSNSQAAEGVAKSLADQQQAAKAERERLAGDAKAKLEAARAAQQAMAAQVSQQQQQDQVLTAQLASLKGTSAAVEEQYRQGQAALAAYQAAQEAKRRAAAERAQQEAAAAAAAAAQGSGQGTGGTGPDPGSGYIPVNVLLPNIPGNEVNNPGGAQAYASARLGAFGWGQDQMPCLVQLWNQESGWQTNATNPSSGAYGIAQALLPSKYYSAGSDWLSNYRTQIDWGLGYIRDRYGSPCGAWGHEVSNNWY